MPMTNDGRNSSIRGLEEGMKGLVGGGAIVKPSEKSN